jgi:hypothetical protein
MRRLSPVVEAARLITDAESYAYFYEQIGIDGPRKLVKKLSSAEQGVLGSCGSILGWKQHAKRAEKPCPKCEAIRQVVSMCRKAEKDLAILRGTSWASVLEDDDCDPSIA